MKAVIVAGGQGTRLAEKRLVPVPSISIV